MKRLSNSENWDSLPLTLVAYGATSLDALLLRQELRRLYFEKEVSAVCETRPGQLKLEFTDGTSTGITLAS